mmetsp:Transcript_9710/g.17510  ORF Transcript_9710/g.17510 Transcript_9710/m.17510 type:complete len:201 (+) Transcript_9710:922-1524(+)
MLGIIGEETGCCIGSEAYRAVLIGFGRFVNDTGRQHGIEPRVVRQGVAHAFRHHTLPVNQSSCVSNATFLLFAIAIHPCFLIPISAKQTLPFSPQRHPRQPAPLAQLVRRVAQKVHELPSHGLAAVQRRDGIVAARAQEAFDGVDDKVHLAPSDGGDQFACEGFGGAVSVETRERRAFYFGIPGDGAIVVGAIVRTTFAK